jgi:hypothetical protein
MILLLLLLAIVVIDADYRSCWLSPTAVDVVIVTLLVVAVEVT